MKNLFKRITSSITALAMTLSLCNGIQLTSFAEEGLVVADDAIVINIDGIGEADNDIALEGYINKYLVANSGISMFQRPSVSGNFNNDERKVYDSFKSTIEAIAMGSIKSSVVSYSQTWTFAEMGLGDAPNQEQFDAATAAIKPDVDGDSLNAIFNALLADLPYEMYWCDKTKPATLIAGQPSLSGTNYTLTYSISFNVSSDYGNGTTLNDRPEKVQKAINKIEEIKAAYSSATDYEKLIGYKDEICALTEYNDAAADDKNNTPYGDPWQLIYVFDGDADTTVVCEGYSKAFKYLCDLTEFDKNIYCYLVTGETSGPHMWNIVQIGTEYYHVDVTNSDGNAVGSGGGLFLDGVTYTDATKTAFNTEVNLEYTFDEDALYMYPTECASLSATDYSETQKTITSITIQAPPTKTDYIVTEEFDPTGLVLTVTYDSGNTADVAYSEANADDFLFGKKTLEKDDKDVTVTYGGKTVTVSVKVTNSVTIDISELSMPSSGIGWEWDGNKLTLSDGFEFIIEEENDDVLTVENHGTIKSGIFDSDVENNGTISGGTFNRGVMNFDGATISGGEFNAGVSNNSGATISDGDFNAVVSNSSGATISGGEFNAGGLALFENYGTISGGTFSESQVANFEGGTITGGTFDALVINDEGGTITGGDFYKVENYAGATIEITNGSVTITQLTLDQGTIYVVVDDVKVKHTHIAGDDATYTNSGDKHLVSGQCKDCPVNYYFSDVEESHSATVFTASGNKITAECACGKEMGTFTLAAPADLNYTGTAKTATVTGEIDGVETPEIKYYDMNGNEAQPINAGAYTAKITVGEATAELDFAIAAKDIDKLTMIISGSREYTGEEQQVEVDFCDSNNYTLVKDKDYRITSGASGTDVGSYPATIEGMGNYTGTVNRIWYITKADPKIGEVTVTTAKIFESTASENIELSYAKADTIPGALTVDAGQNLTEGTVSLNWTFVPSNTQNYNTVTGTVDVTVTADTIKSIEVTGTPAKTEYVEGDKFDPTGLTVTATYESGATKEINNSLLTFTPETLKKDNTSVTVSYNGKTAEKPVDGIIVRGKLAADKFKFTAPTGLVYDKTAKAATVEPIDTGVGEITVRYFNGDEELSGAPVNAGTYNVVINVALGDEYVAATNLSDASWTFTIEKATPSIKPSVTSPDKIYDTTPVSNIVIDSGIDVEGTIKLDNVTELSDEVSSYPVIFIPNDTDNYNTVNGTVGITVEKDTIASIKATTPPTKKEYTYGEKFNPNGLVITATYASGNKVDITYTADNKNEFSFTPEELTVATTEVTVTYAGNNKITDKIEVKVNKATPEYDAPTNLKANYGDTLADVELPDGWRWNGKPDTSIGDAGINKFPATYSKGTNYEDVTTELAVVVSPKTIYIDSVTVEDKEYNGKTDADVSAVTFNGIINSDKVECTATGTFADKNAGENKSVTVKVTITNKNYTLDNDTFTTTATINKADPAVTIPQTASAITGLPLSKATLPDGWTWDNPTTVPEDGQSYGITYTPDDTTNYNTLTAQVKVTVSDCTHPETKVDIKEATCTEDGLKTTICKICDEPTGTEVIPAEHKWNNDYTVDKEATCTKNGQKSIHCAKCNEIKSGSIVVIPSGHIWNDDYTIDTEATCTTDGSKSIHCKNCTEIMPDSEVTIAASHKWNECYTSDSTKHWIDCANCDETKDENNHVYGYTQNSKKYCSVCGNGYGTADDEGYTEKGPGAGYTDPIHTAPKPIVPQIMGENGKTGWDVISDELVLAQEGDTVVIDMNGTTKLPKAILNDIAGRNVDIVLDMGNGITWTINGETVTNPKAVDMRVSKNVKRIPVNVIDNVTGDNFNMEISLAHNGDFGFEAMLTISLGRKYNDYYANLYYYNPSDKAMEFIDSDLIANGNAQLVFNHASDYAIVIDEEALGDDVSSAAGVTAESEAMDTETVSVVFALPLVLAAGFVIRKKLCR